MALSLQLCIFCVTSVLIAIASPCSDCDGVNVTCVDGQCLPRCVNVTASGECLQCRNSRFYGKQCENDCPHTCLNSTCHINNSHVVCIEGCLSGKMGDNCRVDCLPSCTQCERHTGRCLGPCSIPLYYGDYCNMTCPPNCRDGCDSDTGVCDSCKPGYRGKYCKQCEKYDGKCTVQCSPPGYFGPNCTTPCSRRCYHHCNRDSGECYSCKSGYRGVQCEISCPVMCSQCEQYGAYCTECFNNQYFGPTCTFPCHKHCVGCNKDKGVCGSCDIGYKGMFCNETCPSNCSECDRYDNICIGPCPTDNVYGADCSIICPHVCNGCNKTTGVCKICAKGYSRTYCNEMCSMCPRNGSYCDPKKCLTPVPTGASVTDSYLALKYALGAVAVFAVIAVSLYITYKLHKRNDRTEVQQSPGVNPSPSDQSQYWTSKYWEINDDDLDSDPVSSKPLSAVLGRCPSPSQLRKSGSTECSELQSPPLPRHINPVIGRNKASDICPFESMFSDFDSVLDNHVYTSYKTEGACAAAVDSVTSLSTFSESVRRHTHSDRNAPLLQREQVEETRRVCPVTSDDARVRGNKDSMTSGNDIAFPKVCVKYISPKGSDDFSV